MSWMLCWVPGALGVGDWPFFYFKPLPSLIFMWHHPLFLLLLLSSLALSLFPACQLQCVKLLLTSRLLHMLCPLTRIPFPRSLHGYHIFARQVSAEVLPPKWGLPWPFLPKECSSPSPSRCQHHLLIYLFLLSSFHQNDGHMRVRPLLALFTATS